MADSNKTADENLDHSDDLIAELARIVADDAKRASVSQSIEERGRSQSPNERVGEAPSDQSNQQQNADDQPQQWHEPLVAQQERREEPAPQPSSPEPVQARPAESRSPAPVAETPKTEPESDPFEFDFSSNISGGTQQMSGEAQGHFGEDDNFGNEVDHLIAESQASSLPEPPAPPAQTREERLAAEALKQEMNNAAQIDEIADLISKAETAAVPREESKAPQTSSVAPQSPEPRPAAPVEAQYDPNSDELFDAQTKRELPAAPRQESAQRPENVRAATPPSAASTPPTAPASTTSNDPLAEIERLIADTGERSASRQSPHSYLSTEQAKTEQTKPQQPTDAAEAAIMAALAAARPTDVGARQVRAQAPIGPGPEAVPTEASMASQKPTAPLLSDEPPRAAKPEPVRKVADKKRNSAWAGGVALLLLVGVAGAVGWNYLSTPNEGGEVPLVTAQNTDVKQVPETADSADEPSVFSALEGEPEDSSAEQLVSRDDTDGASGENVARVITPSTTEDAGNGLTNRKVKTVTVLADGTIVTGDEASAGAQQLPDDVRPNVPAVGTATDPANTPATATTDADPIADAIAQAEGGTGTEPVAGGDETTDLTAADTQTETPAVTIDANAPTPPARPAGLGTNQPLASAVLNNAATQTTTQTPTATTTSNDSQPLSLVPETSSPTPTSNSTSTSTNSAPVTGSSNQVNAPFYVQLASQRSPEAAQSTVTTVTRQFGNVLGGQTIGVNRVDLNDKGIYYRVLVPANSIEEANTICANIKGAGGDCFVRNN